MYHYLTGAASWLLVTVITKMFGVKGKMGDLVFEPALVKEQFNEVNEAGIHLFFAERPLYIVYKNTKDLDVSNYQVISIKIEGVVHKKKPEILFITREEIQGFSKEKETKIEVELA